MSPVFQESRPTVPALVVVGAQSWTSWIGFSKTQYPTKSWLYDHHLVRRQQDPLKAATYIGYIFSYILILFGLHMLLKAVGLPAPTDLFRLCFNINPPDDPVVLIITDGCKRADCTVRLSFVLRSSLGGCLLSQLMIWVSQTLGGAIASKLIAHGLVRRARLQRAEVEDGR